MTKTEPRIGSARIVRCDEHNVAVEVYLERELTTKDENGKRIKTGATACEWSEKGYFGHRIDHAAESALFLSMPFGEPITKDMIRAAVKEITENTNV